MGEGEGDHHKDHLPVRSIEVLTIRTTMTVWTVVWGRGTIIRTTYLWGPLKCWPYGLPWLCGLWRGGGGPSYGPLTCEVHWSVVHTDYHDCVDCGVGEGDHHKDHLPVRSIEVLSIRTTMTVWTVVWGRGDHHKDHLPVRSIEVLTIRTTMTMWTVVWGRGTIIRTTYLWGPLKCCPYGLPWLCGLWCGGGGGGPS